jgi:hypothetical protein
MLCIKVGADAGISIFDPARVIDKATYEPPRQYSEGFRYVMIGYWFRQESDLALPRAGMRRPDDQGFSWSLPSVA